MGVKVEEVMEAEVEAEAHAVGAEEDIPRAAVQDVDGAPDKIRTTKKKLHELWDMWVEDGFDLEGGYGSDENGEDGKDAAPEAESKEKEEKKHEHEGGGGCCSLCGCLIPIAVIVLIVFAVLFRKEWMEKQEKNPLFSLESAGWPLKCFVTEEFTFPELVPSCSTEVEQLCPEEFGALNDTLDSFTAVQRCIAREIFGFSQPCRNALDVAPIHPVFPPQLKEGENARKVTQACEKDFENFDDDCERFVEDLQPRNLCQVYEASICILSRDQAVSSECKSTLDDLDIQVPLNYGANSYVSERRDDWFKRYAYNPFGTAAIVLGVLWLITCCCFAPCRAAQKEWRHEKRKIKVARTKVKMKKAAAKMMSSEV